MTLKRTILPTAVAVAALSFAAVMAAPALAQMKEQTVTVGGAPMYPSKNIIQNAVNSKDHTTLVAAVKAAGFVWDGERLDHWLENPRTFLKGTKMSFAGIPDATDRRERSATGGDSFPSSMAPGAPWAGCVPASSARSPARPMRRVGATMT